MKKKVLSILLACSMIFSLAACGQGGGEGSSGNSGSSSDNASEGSSVENQSAGELVNGRFAETRKITVEIYDRGNDGGSDPENNMYTEYIKKGMLEEHNVEVTFKKVPRWTEVDDINNLLAAKEAPDICVTYSYPTVLTYAQMGG